MQIRNRILKKFIFTGMTSNKSVIYTFGDYKTINMQETIEHRVIRSKYHIKKVLSKENQTFETDFPTTSFDVKKSTLLPVHQHKTRPARTHNCEPLEMPWFLYGMLQSVQTYNRRMYCESRAAEWDYIRHIKCENSTGKSLLSNALESSRPQSGWFAVSIPDKETLVADAGKLAVLDSLLKRLKDQGHRVLIYSQMTKMIDLLEEYMWHRKHRYMRLDGSSKISARRDMVADFQSRDDIFVFLLSTRAGGLGINLTAADTVIFYDSDWNPTVDQQAMDRAHRLGQTKQVTVYRLICKGTIEERILRRAREKSEIQRMVISGANFRPDTLKAKEVVSLLLDDDEVILKYNVKTESNCGDDFASEINRKRIKKECTTTASTEDSIDFPTQIKMDDEDSTPSNRGTSDSPIEVSSIEPFVPGATRIAQNEDSTDAVVEHCNSTFHGITSPTLFDYNEVYGQARRRHHPRGTKRGRPRGSSKRGCPVSRIDTPKSFEQSSTSQSVGESFQSLQQTDLNEGRFSPNITPLPIRRGPGRPRLKTRGPVNHGVRGVPRTRKPIGPLVVPLGRSPAPTPNNRSPNASPIGIDFPQNRTQL